MSHDVDVSDLLSRAIGDFREELLLWIDTELTRLREREPAEGLVTEHKPAAASGSPFSISSGRFEGGRESPNLRPGTDRREPQAHERAPDRDSVVEPSRSAVAFPDPRTDPEPGAPLSNSRRRLDALARMLDRRLNQAQGPAETNGGAGHDGSDAGAEDDTP